MANRIIVTPPDKMRVIEEREGVGSLPIGSVARVNRINRKKPMKENITSFFTKYIIYSKEDFPPDHPLADLNDRWTPLGSEWDLKKAEERLKEYIDSAFGKRYSENLSDDGYKLTETSGPDTITFRLVKRTEIEEIVQFKRLKK